ncbi:hypothetical protein SH449x_004628 [Pirellulaceae bacterium SH449]
MFASRYCTLNFCLTCLVVFCSTGATCLPKRQLNELKPVPVFTVPPTLDQLTEVLNRTTQVHSLQSNSISVRVNQETSLSSTLTWMRERNFRMTASIAGFRGLDLGSNQDAFWMTIRIGMTPNLFYARHDEFDAQPVRRILPVSPLWLIEALGVTAFDPNSMIQEPVVQADGMIQLTTFVPSAGGNLQRILVVDPQFGFTRQIFLRDATGRLIAQSQQSNHEYYSEIQTSLPHKVKIQLDPAMDDRIELDITVGSYMVNGMSGNSGTQFAFPNTNGFQVINIAPPLASEPAAPLPIAPPPAQPQINPSFHSSLRGVPWDGVIQR